MTRKSRGHRIDPMPPLREGVTTLPITFGVTPDPRIDTLLDAVATVAEQGAESRLRVEQVLAEMAVLQDQATDALRLLRRIVHMEKTEMVKLADLQDAVAEQTSVTAGVVTLIDGLRAQLETALDNGSDEEIQAVIDQMKANSAALASAVTVNTPAPEEPAPEVPGEEPAPEVPGEEPAPEPTPDEGSDTVAGA